MQRRVSPALLVTAHLLAVSAFPALKQLLHKETKLLQTVDRLKIQAHGINRDAKTQQMLEAMAKPKA